MSNNSLLEQFDPFGWLEKWITSRHLHLLIRLVVIVIGCMFSLSAVLPSIMIFYVKPLWAVETLIFFAFLISLCHPYRTLRAFKGSQRNIDTLDRSGYAFCPTPHTTESLDCNNIYGLYAVFYWMTATTSLTLWGIWTLRRSFSITVEVREPGDKRALPLVETSDLPG